MSRESTTLEGVPLQAAMATIEAALAEAKLREAAPQALLKKVAALEQELADARMQKPRVAPEPTRAAPVHSSGRLAGKVAVITGAAGGIGEACARTFVREGATVLEVLRKGGNASKLAGELPGVTAYEVELSSSADVNAMFEAMAKAHGRIDIVVNNAGVVNAPTDAHLVNDEDWHRVMNTNLHGAWYVIRAALKQMLAQEKPGGVILNMTSVCAEQAVNGVSAYTATKAGLVGLTRQIAVEYARKGIRCVALHPTATETSMIQGFAASLRAEGTPESIKRADDLFNWNPMPGMVQPQDIADAALFLCSDEARFVTGCVLPVDGGYCAGSYAPHSRGDPHA